MAKTANEQLMEALGHFYDDPLGYVMFAFPWDTEPSIQMVPLAEKYKHRFNCKWGPDEWACEFLDQLGDQIRKRKFDGKHAVLPIQFSTASGHGIGKTVLTSFLIKFILDTRPRSKGMVTATTATQLRTKTWAELGKWHRMSLTSHLFRYSSTRDSMVLEHKDMPGEWNCQGVTCKEENSESFQGLHASNSTPFYIFDEACHDDKTDVMTRRGWVRFKDVREDDLLLTPEGWQKPAALHVSHRKGKMLEINKRGLSISVTPNHKMYGTSHKGFTRKIEAKDVTHLMAPRTVEWSNAEYPVSDDQLILDAWYYSEGHLIYGKRKKNGARKIYGFGITNNEDNGITEVIERLGLKYKKHNDQWLVYDQDRGRAYRERGKGCLKKSPPAWMLSLSRRQLRLFLGVYVEGDGYIRGKRSIIYTSSPRMAKVLHAMAVLAGYNSSLTVRPIKGQRKWVKDHWAVSSQDGYVITLSETGAKVKLTKDLFKEVEYDGMVYCATVPAGLLLTRRNGTVIWSGNSGVPDKIFEAREGGTTDGEPMTFDFGNPTRNTGMFFENCAGRFKHRYIVRTIDSRSVHITNKAKHQQWIDDYGIDSDFVKVRVLGRFPSAGSLQFIESNDVKEAMSRELVPARFSPLVLGVDVARRGQNSSCIAARRGDDARTFPIKDFKGYDAVQLSDAVIAEVLYYRGLGIEYAMIFVDATGVGGPVADILRHAGYRVTEVNFGNTSPDKTYRFVSDMIWGRLKEHIKTRLVLPRLTDRMGPKIYSQLTQRDFGYTLSGKISLESKDDMESRVGSPDEVDALACTYFREIAPLHRPYTNRKPVNDNFDPMAYGPDESDPLNS